MTRTVRPMREEEREAVSTLHRRAFNVPPQIQARLERSPADEIRVVEEDGTLNAALRVHPIAHFFGGRSVPAAGIGAVAVAADARGRGTAEHLMISTLRELRGRGVPISMLYPATVPLYRRCGYEYAGLRVVYRTPLRLLPRAPGPEVGSWDDGALEEIAACYRAWAVLRNGVVDRPRPWWRRVLEDLGGREVLRACVREQGRITGYLVYTQDKRDDGPWTFDLTCRDLVWTTPGSAAALLAYAGRHRSTARDLLWAGPPNEPLATLLPEQDLGHEAWFRPMLRLVDLPAALRSRGYPAGIEAAVELRVDDPVLPENSGALRLEVSGGEASVDAATSPAASVDVATLAAIWSGMLSAADARRLGRLDAPDREVSTLDALFAGPTPWVNDWF